MSESKEKITDENWRFTCIITPEVSAGQDISTDVYSISIDDITIPIIAFGINDSREKLSSAGVWEKRVRLMAAAPKMYKLLVRFLEIAKRNLNPEVCKVIEDTLKEARGEK